MLKLKKAYQWNFKELLSPFIGFIKWFSHIKIQNDTKETQKKNSFIYSHNHKAAKLQSHVAKPQFSFSMRFSKAAENTETFFHA